MIIEKIIRYFKGYDKGITSLIEEGLSNYCDIMLEGEDVIRYVYEGYIIEVMRYGDYIKISSVTKLGYKYFECNIEGDGIRFDLKYSRISYGLVGRIMKMYLTDYEEISLDINVVIRKSLKDIDSINHITSGTTHIRCKDGLLLVLQRYGDNENNSFNILYVYDGDESINYLISLRCDKNIFHHNGDIISRDIISIVKGIC